MARPEDNSLQFFAKASPAQWSYLLGQYKEVFKTHAETTRGVGKKGTMELIKLDNWYLLNYRLECLTAN